LKPNYVGRGGMSCVSGSVNSSVPPKLAQSAFKQRSTAAIPRKQTRQSRRPAPWLRFAFGIAASHRRRARLRRSIVAFRPGVENRLLVCQPSAPEAGGQSNPEGTHNGNAFLESLFVVSRVVEWVELEARQPAPATLQRPEPSRAGTGAHWTIETTANNPVNPPWCAATDYGFYLPPR
jgi:hypothetical protein